MNLKNLSRISAFLVLLLCSTAVYSQTVSFTFPDNSTDTITVNSDPWWWHVGDHAQGDRVLSKASTGGTLFLVFPENVLSDSCSPNNWVDLELSINGNAIATHRVVEGDVGAAIPFTLASPASGTVTIRIEETNEVCGGGGSIQIDDSGQSYIEFNLSSAAPVPVPMLSFAGLILMSGLMAFFGLYFGRRRFTK